MCHTETKGSACHDVGEEFYWKQHNNMPVLRIKTSAD